jgi:hypothetical protein
MAHRLRLWEHHFLIIHAVIALFFGGLFDQADHGPAEADLSCFLMVEHPRHHSRDGCLPASHHPLLQKTVQV